MAPTIDSLAKVSSECKDALAAMEPKIITDRISPIKRRQSHGKIGVVHQACPLSCKEREERIRSRKLRDRTHTHGAINAAVNAAATSTSGSLAQANTADPNPQAEADALGNPGLVVCIEYCQQGEDHRVHTDTSAASAVSGQV
ncbi:hypothetical protein LTR22_028497, partial [Elasticomyces elasticus]